MRCAIYTRKSTEEGLDRDLIHWTPRGNPPKPTFSASVRPDGSRSWTVTTTVAIPEPISLAPRWNDC
jgi:hypothetical protein